MNDRRQPSQPEQTEGFNVGDVYFVLFRQKWIILTFCVLGFVAAGVISVIKPPQYESEAKLYIQYLKSVDPRQTGPDQVGVNVSPDTAGEMVENEMVFLSSLDVANEVVDAVGADRILAKLGGGDDTNAAAGVVMNSLIKDDAPKSLSILRIAVQNPDKDVARDILRSILEAYLRKSDAMHSLEMPQDLITNQVEEYRAETAEAENKLNKAKQEAGIISSLDETKKNLSERYEQNDRELRAAEVEMSGAKTALKSPPTNSPASEASTNATQEIPRSVSSDYQSVLDARRGAMNEYSKALQMYTEDSPMLKDARLVVSNLDSQLSKFEEQYPGIGSSAGTVAAAGQPQNGNAFDPMLQALTYHQLENKVNTLKAQRDQIVAEKDLVDSKAAEITELEDTWKFKSDMLKASLARVVVASSGAGHQEFSGGIKIIEKPTPAVRKRSKQAKKMMLMALGGGVGAGIFLAFFIEMVLDRSVKRPAEIETKLKLPLFISIPDVNGNGHARIQALPAKKQLLLNGSNGAALVKSNGKNSSAPEVEEIAVWDPRHSLHKFYSGLRDRLIVNFEVRNLNHNPKLVGVTSCNRGAGVSTVAAGLAASLSETGDGNVLLVDMRGEEGASQQFYKGKPAGGLDAAAGAATRNDAQVHEHLYAANGGGEEGEMPSTLSKRFATLMPKLKASDYDYIIFDMPPVSQTSMTARLSGLMDMVLLVIESEKTNRDSVKRATALMKESKAHVSTVLNKVHTYVPTRLHQEYLDDEV